ncbi:glycosyltransferase family 2 protein [Aeromicrobium sp. S22]|uniref:glycosyltransferase family 2 protein n=1 Tax=Aeromicrobium sp. S22 TaxID=2662029 RepID=UPI001892B0E1|nr:glycosyltransferase [Aeromicrobium sp. S22]
MNDLQAVQTVVVHHNSIETLRPCLESMVAQGLPPSQIHVVDNSEMLADVSEAVASVHPAIRVSSIANRGYAAAINHGVASTPSDPETSLLLVVTHEVTFSEGAVEAMVRELQDHPGLTAVGPALRNASTGASWSNGGFLTRVLSLPRHHDGRKRSGRATLWLDGAAVLYRLEELQRHPMSEHYFLYMEEVDYHLQINQRGGTVKVLQHAQAEQSSHGTPAYFLARNVQLFQASWGTLGLRSVAVLWECSKCFVRGLRAGAPLATLRQLAAGYGAGRKVLAERRTGL